MVELLLWLLVMSHEPGLDSTLPADLSQQRQSTGKAQAKHNTWPSSVGAGWEDVSEAHQHHCAESLQPGRPLLLPVPGSTHACPYVKQHVCFYCDMPSLLLHSFERGCPLLLSVSGMRMHMCLHVELHALQQDVSQLSMS